MFCKNCGNQIADGIAFCPVCNTATGVAPVQQQVPYYPQAPMMPPPPKKKSKLPVILISVAVVAVVAVVALVLIFGDSNVSIVKDGYLTEYSEKITVGEAFDDYFASPEWKAFESEEGKDIVEFNGKCEYDGEEVDVCLQFTVDVEDGKFEITYADKNGVKMSMLQLVGLLNSVYDK